MLDYKPDVGVSLSQRDICLPEEGLSKEKSLGTRVTESTQHASSNHPLSDCGTQRFKQYE